MENFENKNKAESLIKSGWIAVVIGCLLICGAILLFLLITNDFGQNLAHSLGNINATQTDVDIIDWTKWTVGSVFLITAGMPAILAGICFLIVGYKRRNSLTDTAIY